MTYLSKKIFFAVLALVGCFLFPYKLFASTFSVNPVRIDLLDLKPGNQLRKSIIVSGGSSAEYAMQLKTNDLVSSWIHQEETKKISEYSYELSFEIRIPKNVSYGNYESVLTIISKRAAETGLDAKTIQAIGYQIPLHIVIGNKDVDKAMMNWVRIPTAYAQQRFGIFHSKGELTSVYEWQNLGNIPSAPDRVIYTLRKEKNGEKIFEYTARHVPVISAFQTKKTILKIPASLQKGTYFASVSVFKKGQYKPEQTFEFDVDVGEKNVSFFEKMKHLSL